MTHGIIKSVTTRTKSLRGLKRPSQATARISSLDSPLPVQCSVREFSGSYTSGLKSGLFESR
jgi:hypothetical protein